MALKDFTIEIAERQRIAAAQYERGPCRHCEGTGILKARASKFDETCADCRGTGLRWNRKQPPA